MKIDFSKKVFGIRDERAFNAAALEIYQYQVNANEIYRLYAESVGRSPAAVTDYREIPFLPIGFFKTHRVACGTGPGEKKFLSSGTTGQQRSRHLVQDLRVYNASLEACFRMFYGDPAEWNILALMPSPDENQASSLVYMTAALMRPGRRNGFFLNDHSGLESALEFLSGTGEKVLLIGLSYALVDFAETRPVRFPGLTVMETGGMKGRKKEMIREELHSVLSGGFGTSAIHSEYGMTELLSQAYSKGEGIFFCPPWMKVLARDINDPFHCLEPGDPGGLNIIDLANFNSCSFISTQDIGTTGRDGSFTVQGRFDHSEMRGCNLLTL